MFCPSRVLITNPTLALASPRLSWFGTRDSLAFVEYTVLPRTFALHCVVLFFRSTRTDGRTDGRAKMYVCVRRDGGAFAHTHNPDFFGHEPTWPWHRPKAHTHLRRKPKIIYRVVCSLGVFDLQRQVAAKFFLSLPEMDTTAFAQHLP